MLVMIMIYVDARFFSTIHRARALYKGLLPKVLRLGPGGAIMLIVKDYVFDRLKEAYPD